ncbi:MAG: cytidylate kinase-like family protein [Odoribacter sp.]|nr:cytidylate kinase-like family protein [Odoribacter sp.]
MEKNKTIITIGRQLGSGGRTIGKKLAERLGIAYYDRELINLASKESGICGEFFEKADEKTSGGLLKAFAMGFSMNSAIFQNNDYLSNESLFQIQSDVIRKVATEGSCVLVGRCADYILRDESNCLNVFVTARMEDRIKRVLEYNNELKKNEVEEFINKADKSRSAYYNYYTDKVWGAAASYDLCVNSSYYGIEATVDYILTFLENNTK